MNFRTSLALLALAAGLAACRLIPPASAPPPAEPPPVVADDDCGAGLLDRWLNALPTAEVNADIAARVGDRPIRTYTEGSPVTMDFNPRRLNVELGADGRIKRFRCG